MASVAASRRTAVNGLMRAVNHGVSCPCHGCAAANGLTDVVQAGRALLSKGRARSYAVPATETTTEYAFEVSAANLRFGSGVTREVGMDFANMKATKVGVFTDPTVAKLLPMQATIESLENNGVKYEVFDRCRVEPNQESWADAIDFARNSNFSHFLAVGGGSSMDTAKVANLFSCYPEADLLEFVNAPVGKGTPIAKTLKPLVAIPTTAGTGSETTGTAIFDYTPLSAKTGIASRAMRPMLGIVDPLNTESCPRPVHISAGLDTLFHALESYTAIPYTSRSPRPDNPIKRPAYQGRNPVADVFSLWALKQTVKYLPRVAANQHDKEALEAMILASTFAGIGFGTAGVHLCHGLSYGISGLNKTLPKWAGSGYQVDHPLVPHGVSVAITAPAVFQFTCPSSPDRHREASAIFNTYKPDNVDDSRVSDEDVGKLLYDRIARFLADLDMPRGISALGYTKNDIGRLVESTLPQARVLVLAPGYQNNEEGRHQLAGILENSMKW